MSGPNFDIVAPFYDQLASLVFGKQLKKAQLYFLHYIKQGATVLIVGGGTGWYLQELLRTGRCSHIVYLEASAKMLGLARQAAAQVQHSCTIEFRQGTEAALQPTEKFDIVVTNCLLDLFPEPQAWQLMQRLDAALHRNGLWLFTDFYIDPSRPAPFWQWPLLKLMYLFFGFTSQVKASYLPDTFAMFKRLGLKRIDEKSFYGGFIKSEVWVK